MKIGLLLAAGLSERFGAANKLLEDLGGRPLITYAATVLQALELDRLIAVISDEEAAPYLTDFAIRLHPSPDDGLGSSLAIGARAAQQQNAHRLLVLLADMPFVTKRHCEEVLERCSNTLPSASMLGDRTTPPVCFPEGMLPALMELTGPFGAKNLLANLPDTAFVKADAATLADIDTPAQLAHWQAKRPLATDHRLQ
ncbi:MAG: nucleotidyltransferase family protein [Pseudomonadota bacterium]